MGKRFRLRRAAWVLITVPAMAVAGLSTAAISQAATHTPAKVTTTSTERFNVKPKQVNNLDCNGYSKIYKALNPGQKRVCTDPRGPKGKAYGNGKYRGRFQDNGHYVGHDEPSVKFISNAAGSGNTMTYFMRLPKDPAKAPTASGSVTDYNELSVAPWFGLPMCDPGSYPQNPCTPDSDTNSGAINDPNAAGSAFMELQLYPPGYPPFEDNMSCSGSQWCAAMTIDSLEAQFNFAGLNTACEEPVNFAYLQTNGVPAGPPSPQLADLATDTPNSHTLKMNPGDVLKLSITDPSAGFTATITDLTTHKTGFITASAANGFMNTNFQTCDGSPFTFHAEYSTASQQNQVPWAALEGGVLMQQEIGHFEVCNSVSNRLPLTLAGGSFSDKNVFQTCDGGPDGVHHVGEGPCSLTTGICKNARTEGTTGPIACPSNNAGSGQLCEFSDAECFPKGTRTVMFNGKAVKERTKIAGCLDNFFQNGDLDFDGTSYRADWPSGNTNFPSSFRYLGPFDAAGSQYPSIQFETDAPASEFLCNTTTGLNCDIKPLGSKFYPFWSMNNSQTLAGVKTPAGACVWNFGNYLKNLTKKTFHKDTQYGTSDTARFGGTNASAVRANPEITGGCPAYAMP